MDENLSLRINMKRRTTDHISSDDLLPKQRIVRRKLQRSLSPVDLESRSTKRLRELREEKQNMFQKYSPKYDQRGHGDYAIEKYPSKYEHRKSSGDLRDERMTKTGYTDKPHRLEYSSSHFEEVPRGVRDIHMSTNRREPLPITSPPNHSPRSSESFDFSLRVGNIDYKLSDTVVKGSLFKEFKRYGYVHIKVIGFGKDRHAFINFNRANDARAASHAMNKFLFHGRPLDVGWSRSTLNRFPDLLSGKFHEPRGLGSTKKRPGEDSYSDFQVSVPSERESYSSSRTIRDISYRNSSTSSRERTHSSHHSSSDKQQPVAVLDPSATRTLFVGNLEFDITERELRDIFSPYGRIESVDIKTSRTNAYSFVKFFNIKDAIQAKNELHGRQYGNFSLSIGFGKGNPSAKVWVGNITCYADVSEIRKELDRFGLIRRVDYVNDDNHAYVHFDGLDAAEAAVASLNNYRFKRTHKPLKIDLMQYPPPRGGDFGGDFDDFEVEIGSYESAVTSTTGGGGSLSRNEDNTRYRSRIAEFHKESAHSGVRGSGSHFKPRERSIGGRVMSEGSNNSPQYTTEKFRHSYNRKRDRSPNMHNDRNAAGPSDVNGGDFRGAKRSRNGFNAYEYHKMYKRVDKMPSHSNERGRGPLGSFEDGGQRSERNFSRDRPRDKTSPKDNSNHKNDEQDETKSVTSASSDIPPPPPPIVPTDTPDTALNLNTSSEVHTEDGDAKLAKADSAESLGDLAKLYPVAWRGNLVLKNTGFPTRMHLIGGDPAVVDMLVRCREGKEDASSLRITQRLRLEPPRLDEVNKRMASAGPSGHCILIALPGPTPSQSSSPDHSSNGGLESSSANMQLRPLRSLVSYLKQKEAAGIVALNATGVNLASSGDLSEMGGTDKDNVGVLHAFPPCEFSQNQLLKVAPNLGPEPAKEDHIVVLLVKGTV